MAEDRWWESATLAEPAAPEAADAWWEEAEIERTQSVAGSAARAGARGFGAVIAGVPVGGEVIARNLQDASRASRREFYESTDEELSRRLGVIQERIEETSRRWMNGEISEAEADARIKAETQRINAIRARYGLPADRAADLAAMDEPRQPIRESQAYQAGEAVKRFVSETFGDPDKADEGKFWLKLAEGAGSMTGFMATAIVAGPASTAYVGATTAAAGQLEDALQSGATEEEALRAAGLSAIVGTSEIVPIMRFLKPLGAKGVGAFVQRVLRNAAEEGLQEGFQGTMQNLIAQGIYDPERGTFKDVPEQMLIGAILGGGIGGIGALVAPDRPQPAAAQPRGAEEPPAAGPQLALPPPALITPPPEGSINLAPDERQPPRATPPISPDTPASGPYVAPPESAILLAIGEAPEDIMEMSPAERAAAVQEAQDAGVTPLSPEETDAAMRPVVAAYDAERPDSPRITPEDRESPIPTNLIDEGKAEIDRLIGTMDPRTEAEAALVTPAAPLASATAPATPQTGAAQPLSYEEIAAQVRPVSAPPELEAEANSIHSALSQKNDNSILNGTAPLTESEARLKNGIMLVLGNGYTGDESSKQRLRDLIASGRRDLVDLAIDMQRRDVEIQDALTENQIATGSFDYIADPAERARRIARVREIRAERRAQLEEMMEIAGRKPAGQKPASATETPATAPAAPAAAPATPQGGPAAPLTPPARPTPFVTPPSQRRATVITPDGIEIEAAYEVVDARKLRHAEGQDQPRFWETPENEERVSNIAKNPDPLQLLPARQAGAGAPIVGPDGVIESGNARTAALMRVSRDKPEAFKRYLDGMRAEGFDVDAVLAADPNSIPIVVGRRITDLDDTGRRAWVKGANLPPVAQMSATEKAQADVDSLTPQVLALYQGQFPLTSAANTKFVNAFLSQLPQTERNALTKDGVLNADGMRRVRQAIFARAYGDRDIVARVAEGDSDAAQSILSSLVDFAPEWAAFRAEIASGAVRPEFDITANILGALRLITKAREDAKAQGRPVQTVLREAVAQDDIFGGSVPAETVAVIRMLHTDENLTRAVGKDRIAARFSYMLDEFRAAGSAAPGLFGDSANVRPEEAINAAGRKDRGAEGDLFAGAGEPDGARDPQGEPGGQRPGGRQDGAANEPRGDEGEGARGEVDAAAATPQSYHEDILRRARERLANGGRFFAADPGDRRPALFTKLNQMDALRVSTDGRSIQIREGRGWATLLPNQIDSMAAQLGAPSRDQSGIDPDAFLTPAQIAARARAEAEEAAAARREEETTPEQAAEEERLTEEFMRLSPQNPIDDFERITGKRWKDRTVPDLRAAIEALTDPSAKTDETDKTPAAPTIEPYSEKSFIVRGVSKEDGEAAFAGLKAKGLWNAKEGGWVFSKKREAEVREALGIAGQNEVATAEPQTQETGGPRFNDEGVTYPEIDTRGVNLSPKMAALIKRMLQTWNEAAYAQIMKGDIGRSLSIASANMDAMKMLEREVGEDLAEHISDQIGDFYRLRREAYVRQKEAGLSANAPNPAIAAAEAAPDAQESDGVEWADARPGDQIKAFEPTYLARKRIQPKTRAEAFAAALGDGAYVVQDGMKHWGVVIPRPIEEDEIARVYASVVNAERAGDKGTDGDETALSPLSPAQPPSNAGSTPGQPPVNPPAAPPRPATYGSSNTLVSSDRAEEIRKKLRDKLGGGTLNAGIDPEVLALGAELAAYHIEAGARKFAQAIRAVAADLGMEVSGLRRYGRAWYNGARDMMEDAGISIEGMDDADTVRAQMDVLFGEAQAPAQPPAPAARADDIPARLRPFVDFFEAGNGFTNIVAARTFARDNVGEMTNKEVEETIEAAIVHVARRIAQGPGTPQQKYRALVDLYGRQPLLAERTSTSVENQAYSTPAPLAYIASQLAGVRGASRVYEPSAGNGMLLMEASKDAATANELDPVRAQTLRDMGWSVITGDAMENELGFTVDVVIANPPFGKVRGDDGNKRWTVDGLNTTEVDHAISLKALSEMKDGGRAVLIIGGKRGDERERVLGYRADPTRGFMNKLYQSYNVVDHFTVDGDLYKRQGAGWPVDVIVIEGRGASTRDLPMKTAPSLYSSWESIEEKLNDRVEPARRPSGSGRSDAVEPAGQGPDAAGVSPRPVEQDRPAGGEGAASGGNARPGGRGGAARPSEQSADGGRNPDGSQRPSAEPVGDAAVPGPSVEGDAQPGRGGTAEGGNAGGVRQRASERARVERQNTEAETNFQVQYSPTSNARYAVGTLIPKNMQTAIDASLERLRERVGDIDDYVAENLGYSLDELLGTDTKPGYFSAEQVDALALAISNIEGGAGFVIGDQTGVGKGRFVAAMLRYAMRQNRIPVFVTKDPGLYSDMIRDLRDIGMKDIHKSVLITNNGLRGDKAIPLDADNPTDVLQSLTPAKQLSAIQKMAANGSLPEGVKMIFTTYSQLQYGPKGAEIPRQRAILNISPNAMFVLDESHEAGGTDTKKIGPDGEIIPTRADFVRQMLQDSAGVVYSSATYAKNPTVMSLYYKTDLSMAVENLDDLADAISKGGVPLQQVVANMLVRAGQYARRERSYEGVDMALDTMPTDTKTAEGISKALSSIFATDTDYMEAAREAFIEEIAQQGGKGGRDNAVGDSSISGVGFSSLMHNVISQALLSLKAPAVVDKAIALAKAGEKPIIALSNTNEAIIADYIEDEGLGAGAPASPPFNTILMRYLERTRRITVKDANDNKTHVWMSDADIDRLGPEGALDAMKEARAFIQSLDLSALPASPIDYILDRLNEAGIRADEITGRGVTLRNGVVTQRAATTAAKKRVMNDYNSGKLDGLVINRSGSTGFSMHATDKKGNDGKQRHMLILQADANIDVFMQMLGRIHRTGQIRLPRYTIAISDLAIEKRPAAVLMRKMASLNANTTASKKSAISLEGVDFLNQYGDEVVADFLRENRDIAAKIAVQPQAVNTGIAAKMTGRLAIMAPKDVDAIYQQIERTYSDYIESLDAMGMNALEAKTLDLQAETLSSATITEGEGGDSPFAEPSIMESVRVRRLGKPYSIEELSAKIDEVADFDVAGADRNTQANIDALEEKMPAYISQAEAGLARANAAYEAAKTDKQRDRANAAISNWQAAIAGAREKLTQITSIIADTAPGSAFILRANDSEGGIQVYAVSLGADISKAADNPTAASRISIRFAIADPSKELRVPISKLIGESPAYSITPTPRSAADRAFEEGGAEATEVRQMLTGNILAGYAKIGRGQIVLYTDADGLTREGVLMPRDFDVARAMERQPVEFRTGEQVMEFLRGGQRMVKTSDGIASFTLNDAGRISISVKRQGGKPYYLNRDVRAITGEFSGRQKAMVATAPANRGAEIVTAYMEGIGARFETTTDKEAARAITGDAIPDIQREQRARAGWEAAPESGDGVTDEDIAALRKRLDEMGLERVGLRIERAFRTSRMRGNEGADIAPLGGFRAFKNNATGALEDVEIIVARAARSLMDAQATLDHEAIHALYNLGLFTPAEWATLSRRATQSWIRKHQVKERYPEGDEALWIEEAIAEEFAAQRAKADPREALSVRKVLARIGEFMEAVGNWARGLGFQSAADVFGRAASGEVGRREAGAGREASRERVDTSTAAFRKWFGDSKVVDENGEPMVVYRGARSDREWFRPSPGWYGVGVYMTSDPRTANLYADREGGNVAPVYASIKNPFVINNEEDADGYPVSPVDIAELGFDKEKFWSEDGGGIEDRFIEPFTEKLKSLGYDGVIMGDGAEIVAFRPEQIKSVFNRGTWNPDSPLIRERRVAAPGAFETYDHISARAVTDAFLSGEFMSRETWRDFGHVMRRTFSDSMDALKRQQTAIERAAGQAIPLMQDAYMAANLYFGRTGDQLRRFYEEDVRGITKNLREAGISAREMDDYLIARHVEERNRQMAKLREIEEPDHQFVKALTDNTIVGGSGFSQQWANGVLRRVARDPRATMFREVARKLDRINAARLDQDVASGMLSQEAADAMRDVYKHYVPLRGFEGEEPDAMGSGRGFDTRGKEQRATGRRSRAESPLSTALAMRANGIIRAEKNRVGRAMLRLVQSNPNPAAWTVDRAETKTRIKKKAVVQIDPVTGAPVVVSRDVARDQKVAASRLDPNVMIVKIGGDEVLIRFENRDLARAMKNMGAENGAVWVRVLGAATRMMSALNTTLNIEWVVTNMFRDLQTAGIQISDEKRKGLAKAMFKNWPAAMKGAAMHLSGKGSGKWKDIADEFAREGGKVDYIEFRDVQGFKRLIEGDITESKLKRMFTGGPKALFDGIQVFTGTVENAIRIAAYQAAVEQGVPKAKAASIARELTVNFNRRGEIGPAMNALYMFFNAAVQGNARLIRSAMKSGFTRKALIGLVGIGALEAMLGAGDDDEYEKVEDYVRERNLVIMLAPLGLGPAGSYWKIPLPYGFNVAKVMGTEIGRSILYGNPEGAAANVVSAAINSFNPIGGQDFIAMATPTLIDPMLDIARNRNFFGSSIRPDYPNDTRPDSEKYFPNVSGTSKALTAWLNGATGGNQFREGAISISPENVDHIASAYLGGFGRLILNLERTAADFIADRPIDAEKAPFVRQIFGQTYGEMPTWRAYDKVSDAVNALEAEIKGFTKAGDAAAVREARQRDPVLTAMLGPMRVYDKRIAALRKKEREIKASSLPDDEKDRRIEAIRQKSYETQRAALAVWDRKRNDAS